MFFKFPFAFQLNCIIYFYKVSDDYYFLEHVAALPIIFYHFQ